MQLEWKKVSGTEKDFCLREISFLAEAGYLTGIAGRNGAGKTTLFRYMLSGKKLYQGEILLDGEPLHGGEEAVHTRQMRKIGHIADERQFFEEYTAMENARLFSVFYENWEEEVFCRVMKQMELSTGKLLGKMSRGERLKFQMAFVMAYHPKLYLLDEVTGGMDPVFRREFFRLLREILETEEAVVLMATHIQEELEEKMDYIGILEQGIMVSFGENTPV